MESNKEYYCGITEMTVLVQEDSWQLQDDQTRTLFVDEIPAQAKQGDCQEIFCSHRQPNGHCTGKVYYEGNLIIACVTSKVSNRKYTGQ